MRSLSIGKGKTHPDMEQKEREYTMYFDHLDAMKGFNRLRF